MNGINRERGCTLSISFTIVNPCILIVLERTPGLDWWSEKKTRPLHAAGNRTRLQREKAYAHYRTPTGSYAHNRIAVWAPTKCPRATDNNTKSLRVPKF